MTPADFRALGETEPPPGSPFTDPTTHWIVPQCTPIVGEQPGGPSLAAASPATQTAPTSASATLSGTTSEYPSPNWTGFQSSSGGYSQAFSVWHVPSSWPTPPYGPTYESSWAGVGNCNTASDSMLQAGTEFDVSTSHKPHTYAWYEFCPMTPQKIANLTVITGSADYAWVDHSGYDQGAVRICTEPVGASSFTCTGTISVHWTTAYTVGSDFECIAERTAVEDSQGRLEIPRLSDINNIQYNDCQGYNGAWQPIGNVNRYYIYMSPAYDVQNDPRNCWAPPWMAETGSIYNSSDFGIIWYRYGYVVDPASLCK